MSRQRWSKLAWLVGAPLGIAGGYTLLAVIALALTHDLVWAAIVVAALSLGIVVIVRRRWPNRFAYQPPPHHRRPIPHLRSYIAGLTALAFIAGQLLALWLYSQHGSTGFDESTQARSQAGVLATLILVLLAAPAGEEALLRGILYPVLRRRSGIVISVLVTSSTFALLHGNLIQLAVVVPLAIVLALTYERTRRLWPCILMHLGFNLAATLIPGDVLVGLAHPVTVALFLIAFGWCAWGLYRLVAQAQRPESPALAS